MAGEDAVPWLITIGHRAQLRGAHESFILTLLMYVAILRWDNTFSFLAAVDCGRPSFDEVFDQTKCISASGHWRGRAQRRLDSISSTFDAMSRIAPILMILTYALLGLLTNVTICVSVGSEQSLGSCMTEELVSILLFWPIFLVGMVALQPIPYVLTNVVLVIVAWMLLRSTKKSKLRSV
ncbi:MAG: hypothetical protein HY567_03005 [Candidatus Kerfeldbacteria bacterium]|nr:hypothetical protein [Candidatus Kerfeldbacteria bacterium]